MTIYAVTANRRTRRRVAIIGTPSLASLGAALADPGYQGHTQVPVFYLDSAVQGIVDADHAKRVAADVVGPDVIVESITVAEVNRGHVATVEPR